MSIDPKFVELTADVLEIFFIKSVLKNMQCCSKLGPKIMDFREYLAKNHEVVRTGKMNEQTNYKCGETDKCVRKLSENYGEHSEESIGVFGRPAE